LPLSSTARHRADAPRLPQAQPDEPDPRGAGRRRDPGLRLLQRRLRDPQEGRWAAGDPAGAPWSL